MSIEQAALAVPAEQRERFLEQAALLEQRARQGAASPLEYQLALRVLLVLCGARVQPGSGVSS